MCAVGDDDNARWCAAAPSSTTILSFPPPLSCSPQLPAHAHAFCNLAFYDIHSPTISGCKHCKARQADVSGDQDQAEEGARRAAKRREAARSSEVHGKAASTSVLTIISRRPCPPRAAQGVAKSQAKFEPESASESFLPTGAHTQTLIHPLALAPLQPSETRSSRTSTRSRPTPTGTDMQRH